ncbi:MAG: hypothetical protein IKZ34_02670 [Alphaproteobacteria bacterium]|nr:hypothetical protein [Alphaproteobacteria bacterium]
MIIQDNTKKFEYIKNTQSAIKSISQSVNSVSVSEDIKSQINRLYSKIFIELDFVEKRLQLGNIISDSKWQEIVSKIDTMYQELQHTSAPFISQLNTKSNLR